MVPWTMLVKDCYNSPTTPVTLPAGGPTDLTNIQFALVDSATSGTYNFCVTALAFY